MDFEFIYVAVIAGVLALAFALFAVFYVLRQEEGSERMREISAAIKEGALAFLHREYQILAIFVVVVAIILVILGQVPPSDPLLSEWAALAFVFGAICSMGAGYAGMNMAIRSNARTAEAARQSLNQGLRVSFFVGQVDAALLIWLGSILPDIAFLQSVNWDVPGVYFGYGTLAIALRENMAAICYRRQHCY